MPTHSRILRVRDKNNRILHKAAKAGGFHEFATPWIGSATHTRWASYAKCIHCEHLVSIAVLEFAEDAARVDPQATSWWFGKGYR